MSDWIAAPYLLQLVQRDVSIHGRESPGDVLSREPNLLIPVTEPACPPVDIETYRTRLARWEAGEGPGLHGIKDFVDILASLDEPASAATVAGEATTYVFLLDADRTRILGGVAIDAPPRNPSAVPCDA